MLWLCIVGYVFADLLGLQADEVLFSNAYFIPEQTAGRFNIGGVAVPTMIMPYLGAPKAWLMRPVFALFGHDTYVVRLPFVVLGAFTFVLTGWVLGRLTSAMTGLIAAVLLATDTAYTLTTVYDWGPVVIQHVCYVGAVAALAGYVEHRRFRYIALAGLLIGLGIWDKALFGWIAFGTSVAVMIWGPVLLRRLRSTVWLTGFIVVGAFPFVHYNLTQKFATTDGTLLWDTADVAGKARMFWLCLNGEGLRNMFSRGESASFDQPSASLLPILVLLAALACLFCRAAATGN